MIANLRRILKPVTLAVVFLLTAACGGGGGGSTTTKLSKRSASAGFGDITLLRCGPNKPAGTK